MNSKYSKGTLIFFGVAALLLIYLYVLPSRKSGTYGKVYMDGTPLPIGSVSLKSEHSAMTLTVYEGEFESIEGKKLSPETHEVVVTVGNPLGLPVPQFEGTAFEKLNGAKYRTQLKADELVGGIDITFNESSLELLDGTGELSVSDQPY